MAVTCTPVTLVRDTVDTREADAATADTANLAEDFTITPSKGMDKMIIEVTVANSHGTVVAKLKSGSIYWPQADLSFSCVQNKISVFSVNDIARFMDSSGNIVLELTPASGKKLQSEHAATVQVIELP